MPNPPSHDPRPSLRMAVFGLCLAFATVGCNSQPREGKGPQGASRAPSDGSAPAAPASSGAGGDTVIPAGRYGAFQSIFTEVARKVVPSVVSITSERTVTGPGGMDSFGGDPFEFFFGIPRGDGRGGPQRRKESGLGSGFISSADGTILTNNHVVEGAQKLTVKLDDEREFEADVVGTDKATDLAVIRIKGKPGNLVPLEFGNSDQLLIGEWVVAVGAPFGLNETVTAGIISAKGRQNTGITTYGNFLQTDAAINPGNSGGPLVNLDGKVIGINTAIFSQSGGYQGIGFAIPVNLARNVMESLVKYGKVTRGWLGVSIQPLTGDMASTLGLSSRQGALIGDVVEGGPAEKAGLHRGDVVLALDGRPLADANDLMNQVALLRPGATAELTVWRDGRKITVKAKVARREEESIASMQPGGDTQQDPEGSALTSLGLEVGEITEAARAHYRIGPKVTRGAVVMTVDPAGAAAEEGIREGDVLVEANRKPVNSPKDLRAILSRTPKGKSILLLVHRQGGTFYSLVTPE